MLYSASIFLSAFLLFLIQPVIAKMILPWFGGSASVWSTCLVFFQSLLLFGYVYAHATTHQLTPRVQAALHVALLGLSFFLLPFAPDPGWKPVGDEDPSIRILVLLSASIGLPYFLLATTSPLLQVWFTRTFAAVLPYRLFSLANLASLAALLSYPILLEPWTSTRAQALAWSGAYVVFAGLCIGAAFRTHAARKDVPPAETNDPPALLERLRWFALAASASILLISVTSHLTQNVASIPFLWILPLSLYLLSFILCFDREGWYRRGVFLWVLSAALVVMSYTLLVFEPAYTVTVAIPVFLIGFFVCCMFCHGELAMRKPPAAYLTSFYLMIAFGGAAGSVFTGFLVPRLFATYVELPIGILLCSLLAAMLFYQRRSRTNLVLVYVVAAAIFGFVMYERLLAADVRLAVRSFYGGLRVMDRENIRLLMHGSVTHGGQFLSGELRSELTTYYSRQSGVGLAISDLPDGPRRIGVIGLGVGTIAAYGRKGDVIRFYEINPQVIEIARTHFSYLHDSPAHIEVVLGDGRLSLERERSQNYDLLAVDAFSGDSIPAHLLSREALSLYFRHLKPGGVLAMHISNASLDLWPVVVAAAESLEKEAVLVVNRADDGRLIHQSGWAMLAATLDPLERPALAAAAFRPETKELRVWTDDYNNLVQILK